jgi:sortase A
MPIMLTLPLGIQRRPRAKSARFRRAVMLGLVALGVALIAAGLWLPAKAELAQHLLQRAWSETRTAGGTVRPWPWADTWPVAQLTLPGSRAPLTVLAGASGRNLAFAPALMDGSVLPGERGVSVIAGHRDTHFRSLAALAIGDRFALERPDGAVYTYEVTALDVIDSEHAMLRLDAEESLVALVTCWPFDSIRRGPLRYIVTCVAETPAVPARPSLL